MEIRKIRKAEMATALQLTWETFLQFEAPDYSQQGIDSLQIDQQSRNYRQLRVFRSV